MCQRVARYVTAVALTLSTAAMPQSIHSGTVTGTVVDPSGAVIGGATVRLTSPIAGYEQSTTSDSAGAFRFGNVPRNSYRLTATALGFGPYSHELEVRSSLPLTVRIPLELAAESASVNVEAGQAGVESDPAAHQDVDRSRLLKLPAFDPAGQLSQAITYSSGAVAADANGFFHPLGDHGQTTFVVDGQPISDQQSKLFSTQLPANAVESMELISGSPDAQYGDKSSLVVNTTTKSGLGTGKAFGSVASDWGSFGTWGGNATLGFGDARFGNFMAVNGIRSGRFLDPPELAPIHDIGNGESVFDRLDFQPTATDAFHLNLFTARNSFQTPNSYDQLGQDQRQRVLTWNAAGGYQRTLSASTLITVNPYVRRDQLDYYPSRDAFSDTPVTAAQIRFLTNFGVKTDISHVRGRHTIKIGTQLQQTRLLESFRFGITDASYLDPETQPGLVPYDLTRGGSLFQFRGRHNINQYAFYAADSIRLGNFTVNAGLRDDQYNGLVAANGIQPRLGIAYLLTATHTVLRAAYARTFETPYNENLILSSGTGSGGIARNVFGSQSTPIEPGRRNQFNAGLQQAFGRWLVADADYFWKFTRNGYDFGVLFNTPITFPVAWQRSKVDGVSARLSTVSLHGFQAYMTLGHTRARYFPPEAGGLIPLGGYSGTVFRIDHDQAYQHTVAVRYARPRNAEWIGFTWRYDSGLVVSGVPSADAALALTAAQQVAIGLSCDGTSASYGNPIGSCAGTVASKLLSLPPAATADPDHNPARVKPRQLFNVALGTDNLFHKEKGPRVTLRLEVENLANRMALYNFLSTFSGTHFVAPRAVQASAGVAF